MIKQIKRNIYEYKDKHDALACRHVFGGMGAKSV